MLQNPTPAKQGTESRDTHMMTRPDNDAGVVRIGDEPTGKELNTVEGKEEILADGTRGDQSTVSTEASHDRRTFSSYPSPILGAETDPTSIPSGFLDDLALERKDTESPSNSMDAVYGSDSCLSAQSDSSTADSSSREGLSGGVNLEAVGKQFGESSTETNPPRFHDPENIWEAASITHKINSMNDKMYDIACHPEANFRDPGSPFQVSARPKKPDEAAPEVESDMTDKRKVHFAPDHSLDPGIKEGYSAERRMNRVSSCCNIM